MEQLHQFANQHSCLIALILIMGAIFYVKMQTVERFVVYDYKKNPEHEQSGRIKYKYIYDAVTPKSIINRQMSVCQ